MELKPFATTGAVKMMSTSVRMHVYHNRSPLTMVRSPLEISMDSPLSVVLVMNVVMLDRTIMRTPSPLSVVSWEPAWEVSLLPSLASMMDLLKVVVLLTSITVLTFLILALLSLTFIVVTLERHSVIPLSNVKLCLVAQMDKPTAQHRVMSVLHLRGAVLMESSSARTKTSVYLTQIPAVFQLKQSAMIMV